jgi:hypothetical protein
MGNVERWIDLAQSCHGLPSASQRVLSFKVFAVLSAIDPYSPTYR